MTIFESLESRVFLSVTLSGGTLIIHGTAGNDFVELSHPLSFPPLFIDLAHTKVQFNSSYYSFPTSAIRRIIVDAGGGDDRIKIGSFPELYGCAPSSWPPVPYPFSPSIPTLILGGAGNDWLVGGSGRDTIFGGSGHDFLYGGGGDDLLFGGDGDDGLDGSAGNDRLFGQAGNDALISDDPNDWFVGQIDIDRLRGGSGDDTLYADSANDLLSGGPGNDLLRYTAFGKSIDGTLIEPAYPVPADIERQEPFWRYMCG